MTLLFVYGSLKQGFPNFHHNRGRHVAGDFRTCRPHPLMLADGVLPCLLPQPGQGLHVTGQLFEAGAEELAAMDALERVGQPGGYTRIGIEVEPVTGGAPLQAQVYVQDAARLAPGGAHVGPLAEYTAEHARSLSW